MLLSRGFSVADFDRFTFGQLINYIYEFERLEARRRGEDVPDLEAKYKQLKALQPIVEQRFENGEITQEQFDNYNKSLKEWEAL